MKIVLTYLFILNVLFGIPVAWSIPNTDVVTPYQGGIQLYGPRDSPDYAFNRVLSSSGDALRQICNNKSITYNIGKVIYTPIAITSGNSPDMLIDSGISGLKLAPFLMSSSFNADISANIYTRAPLTSKVVYNGFVSDSWRKGSYGFRVTTGVRVYRGAESIENGILIPRQPMYMYTCYDTAGVARETTTILIDNIPLTINVLSCTPDTKSFTINMDGVPLSNIENASSTTLINTKRQTFSLKCDTDISVYYSIVDLNDLSNNSTTSTLTADSTATGVGFAITTTDGALLNFGVDGSAAGIPGQKKYPLGKTGQTYPYILSHQLGFSYVRKTGEPIKTGTAKSLIGITYSYQ